MKRRYKILYWILGIEFCILFILNNMDGKIESWLGNTIVTFLLLVPIQLLLFYLSRDEAHSNKKRMFFKIIFWYIVVCYVLGGIALLL